MTGQESYNTIISSLEEAGSKGADVGEDLLQELRQARDSGAELSQEAVEKLRNVAGSLRDKLSSNQLKVFAASIRNIFPDMDDLKNAYDSVADFADDALAGAIKGGGVALGAVGTAFASIDKEKAFGTVIAALDEAKEKGAVVSVVLLDSLKAAHECGAELSDDVIQELKEASVYLKDKLPADQFRAVASSVRGLLPDSSDIQEAYDSLADFASDAAKWAAHNGGEGLAVVGEYGGEAWQVIQGAVQDLDEMGKHWAAQVENSRI